jgi:hypothetical protein
MKGLSRGQVSERGLFTPRGVGPDLPCLQDAAQHLAASGVHPMAHTMAHSAGSPAFTVESFHSDILLIASRERLSQRPTEGPTGHAMATLLLIVLLLVGCAQAERRINYGAECRKSGDRLDTREYNGCLKSYQQRDSKASIVF